MDRDKLVCVAASAVDNGTPLAEATTWLRSASREVFTRARLAKGTSAARLRAWNTRESAEVVGRVKRAVPCLEHMNMAAVPSPVGLCVRVKHTSAADLKACVAWSHEHFKQSPVCGRMRQEWLDRSDLLLEEQCPPCADLPKDPAAECAALRFCICSEAGKRVHKKAHTFLAALKEACRPLSAARQRLKDGVIVVRLIGSSRVVQRGELADVELHEAWWHIGMQYITPFRPTFMELRRVADLGEMPADMSRVYVASTGKFAVLHKVIEPLGNAAACVAEFWVLEDSRRQIPQFSLRAVPLLPLAALGDDIKFWPRPSRARARRAPGNGGGEEDRMPAVEDGDGGDDDGDGAPEDEPDEPEEVNIEAGELERALEELMLLPPDIVQEPPASRRRTVTGGAAAPSAPEEDPPLPPPLDLPEEAEALPSGADAAAVVQRVIAARALRGAQEDALAKVSYHGGTVSFYRSGNFEAKCGCGHGACRMTARGFLPGIDKEDAHTRSRGGRRPLGFLLAWLAAGSMFGNKEEHRSDLCVLGISKESRRAARIALDGLDGAELIKQFERKLRPGEEEESVDII